MKRILSCFLMIAILFVPVITSAEPAEKEITVMIYMAGGNLESDFGIASAKIEEMANTGFDADQINVIILAGGTRQWSSLFAGESEAFLLQLAQRQNSPAQRILERYPEMNMGDAQSLTQLLDYGKRYFPAKKYALIFWGQSIGPMNGICWDENNADFLTLAELDAAFRESGFSQNKMSWIGFDVNHSCSAEVASKIVPYAEYMTAFPSDAPSSGWNYSFLKDLQLDRDGAETGKRIIDASSENLQDRSVDLSCLDLSEMETVDIAVDAYFEKITAHLDENTFLQLEALMSAAAKNSITDSPDLTDLISLCECYEQVDPEALAAIKDAVRRAVVTHHSAETSGLSICHPLHHQKDDYDEWCQAYHLLGFCPGYSSYIDALKPYLTAQH